MENNVENEENLPMDARMIVWKRRRAGLKGCGCVILALLLLAAIIWPNLKIADRSVWEVSAKETLRLYGEAQQAYWEADHHHDWASWSALKQAGYIREGYNRSNLIENYSVWTDETNWVELPHSVAEGTFDKTFTAVAFPRVTTPPGYLSTFIIREDEILRVYRPSVNPLAWGQGGDFGGRTWEPIR